MGATVVFLCVCPCVPVIRSCAAGFRLYETVAGRHRRNPLEELRRCPHLYLIRPGAAQLAVKALPLRLVVRFSQMHGQGGAHTSRQDAAEIVASLVIVKEADTVRRRRGGEV